MPRMLIAAACLALIATLARAQDEKPAPELTEDAKAMLENLDADGDGALSESELPEQYRRVAMRQDADNDGKLGGAELNEVAKAAAQLREAGATKRRGEVRRQMKDSYEADKDSGLFLQAARDYNKATNGEALAIYKDGKLLLEAYDNGYDKALPHELASGTKSFIGVIAACAVEDGLFGWDDKVCETIPEWKEDERSRITVRMLLSLCAGLPAAKDALQGSGTEDKYKYAIGLKCKHEPGKRFEYGPAQYFAFGEFLKRKLAPKKETIKDYFMRRIGNDICIDLVWRTDKAGNHSMPSGIYIVATEWAKFGEFVRNGGKVGDKQLLKQETLAECFKPSKAKENYGLTWWLGGGEDDGESGPTKAGKNDWVPSDLVYAAGKGKQRLTISRAKGLTIVRLAKDTNTYENGEFLSWLLRGRAM